jgi:hypothetical protein
LVIGTVAVLVTGNLAILAASRLSRLREPEPTVSIDGIENVRVVDTKLWRGNAPSVEGYRGLAERGVSTVVDLRAERDLIVPSAVLDDIGIERVLIPIRDGQTPDPAQSARFMDVVREPRDGSSCIAVPASAAPASWRRPTWSRGGETSLPARSSTVEDERTTNERCPSPESSRHAAWTSEPSVSTRPGAVAVVVSTKPGSAGSP